MLFLRSAVLALIATLWLASCGTQDASPSSGSTPSPEAASSGGTEWVVIGPAPAGASPRPEIISGRLERFGNEQNFILRREGERDGLIRPGPPALEPFLGSRVELEISHEGVLETEPPMVEVRVYAARRMNEDS